VAIPLEHAEAGAIKAAGRVLQRLEKEYREYKITQPERAAEYFLSLVPAQLARWKSGSIVETSDCIEEPNAMKYLRHPRGHVHKFARFLPFMADATRIFEIGVGPGFMFRLLMDVYDADMHGCDLDPNKNVIFRELRRELKIDDRVQEHRVAPQQEIPIPPETEALVSFWTVFNFKWGISDHRWFLDFCSERLSGEKKVVLLFNSKGFDDKPEVKRLYHQLGTFPLRDPGKPVTSDYTVEDAFCILHLG